MSDYDYDGTDNGLPDPRDAYDRLVAFVAAWGDGEVDNVLQAVGQPLGHPFDSGYSGRSTTCNELVVGADGAGVECGLPRVGHTAHDRHPLHTRDVAALLHLGRPDCEWRVDGMKYRSAGGQRPTESSMPVSEAVMGQDDGDPAEARQLAESLIESRGGWLVRRFTAASAWVRA